MAGSSWGPQIHVVTTPDDKSCRALRDQILTAIEKQARSNLNGSLERFNDDGATVLVRGVREVARLQCMQAR